MSKKHYHVLPQHSTDKDLTEDSNDKEIDETESCFDDATKPSDIGSSNALVYAETKFINWIEYIQRRTFLLFFIFVLFWIAIFNLLPMSGKNPLLTY